MTHISATVPVTPVRFVTDSHGARYETLAEDHIAAVSDSAVDSLGVASAVEAPRPGRIVVGVDGSESSIAALRHGIRIASALNASVEVVVTWRPLAGYGSDFAAAEYSPDDDASAILSGAKKSVFGATVPDWFSSTIQEGDAASVLIEQSEGAEMLVVGSRGHGGVAGILLGSVSSRCAEHAHCPVLIIH